MTTLDSCGVSRVDGELAALPRLRFIGYWQSIGTRDPLLRVQAADLAAEPRVNPGRDRQVIQIRDRGVPEAELARVKVSRTGILVCLIACWTPDQVRRRMTTARPSNRLVPGKWWMPRTVSSPLRRPKRPARGDWRWRGGSDWRQRRRDRCPVR